MINRASPRKKKASPACNQSESGRRKALKKRPAIVRRGLLRGNIRPSVTGLVIMRNRYRMVELLLPAGRLWPSLRDFATVTSVTKETGQGDGSPQSLTAARAAWNA